MTWNEVVLSNIERVVSDMMSVLKSLGEKLIDSVTILCPDYLMAPSEGPFRSMNSQSAREQISRFCLLLRRAIPARVVGEIALNYNNVPRVVLRVFTVLIPPIFSSRIAFLIVDWIGFCVPEDSLSNSVSIVCSTGELECVDIAVDRTSLRTGIYLNTVYAGI